VIRESVTNAEITVNRPEGRILEKTPDEGWLHPPSLGGVILGSL
jgi:hypothetical protein